MKRFSVQTSEYGECVALAEYLELLKYQGRILAYAHIPNETFTTSWSQKSKNKRLGVKKGFPDYCIVFNGKVLFIEMKREHGGVVSPEQKEWLEMLEKGDCEAVICHVFDDEKGVIDDCLLDYKNNASTIAI
jgi:ribosomal protein L33